MRYHVSALLSLLEMAFLKDQRLKMPTNVADTAQIVGAESHDREQLVKAENSRNDRQIVAHDSPSQNCSEK